MPSNQSDLTPRFKLVFFTVVALTVISFVTNVVLALFGGNSELVISLADLCANTYIMGFGAVVGLIGGKIT